MRLWAVCPTPCLSVFRTGTITAMTGPVLSAGYERKLSPIERLWVVANRLYPPFASQLVLEGEGEFDLDLWRRATSRASIVNPGSRLVLRKHLGLSHWVDSKVPVNVHLLDGSDWNGTDPLNAPFLKRLLPAHSGPTCEILLLTGNPKRVILRAHHAVTDGIGGLKFVEDVFRELRGEECLGTTGRQTDLDIIRKIGTSRAKIVKNDCETPWPPITTDKASPGTIWRRVTVPGRHSKLLARITQVIAHQAYESGRCSRESAKEDRFGRNRPPVVRIDIASDMRHFFPDDPPSSANLTGMLTIEVSESDRPADIIRAICAERRAKHEGVLIKTLAPVRWVPLHLLMQIWRYRTRRSFESGHYATSGAISNIGLLPIHRYQGGGFKAKTGFAIPPGNEGVPVIVIFNWTDKQTEIVASAANCMATGEQLENLLEKIKDVLMGNSH